MSKSKIIILLVIVVIITSVSYGTVMLVNRNISIDNEKVSSIHIKGYVKVDEEIEFVSIVLAREYNTAFLEDLSKIKYKRLIMKSEYRHQDSLIALSLTNASSIILTSTLYTRTDENGLIARYYPIIMDEDEFQALIEKYIDKPDTSIG